LNLSLLALANLVKSAFAECPIPGNTEEIARLVDREWSKKNAIATGDG
jgi:hypothetical protein